MHGESTDKNRPWRLICYMVLQLAAGFVLYGVFDAFAQLAPHEKLIARTVVGSLFAAFCVWLTVRIIQRREQWAINIAMLLIVFGGMFLAGIALLFS